MDFTCLTTLLRDPITPSHASTAIEIGYSTLSGQYGYGILVIIVEIIKALIVLRIPRNGEHRSLL